MASFRRGWRSSCWRSISPWMAARRSTLKGRRCSSSSRGLRRIRMAPWRAGARATAIPAVGTASAASITGL
uniref:Uncharacterized protein n=1 Tax=Arundo donax TaxID=35708 RepID=A0A0A9DSS8_ARUDO